MHKVTIMAVVDADPDAVYERLADFPGYVALAPSVRSVDMSGDRSTSTWEVTFRDGILRWTEEDRYDPVKRRIEFSQTAGDMDRFDGWWTVVQTPEGSLITFFGEFDLGLPGLAEFLEPVAAQALEDNIVELINGLFEGNATFVDDVGSPVDEASAEGTYAAGSR